MIFLETQRLIIRNVEAKDVDIIYDYRNNEICAKYQRGQIKEREGIGALIERRKNDVMSADTRFMVAIVLKETDEMIGEIVALPENGTITLGYTISYKHHRNGYAFEALTAIIDTLHEKYPEFDFISFTDPENIPSMSLLKKLGYRDLGYAPDITSQVFGKWIKEEK